MYSIVKKYGTAITNGRKLSDNKHGYRNAKQSDNW